MLQLSSIIIYRCIICLALNLPFKHLCVSYEENATAIDSKLSCIAESRTL